MFTKVSFSENPIVIIGCDEDKEKTFNNEKYSSSHGSDSGSSDDDDSDMNFEEEELVPIQFSTP